jgi:hypothetical protein
MKFLLPKNPKRKWHIWDSITEDTFCRMASTSTMKLRNYKKSAIPGFKQRCCYMCEKEELKRSYNFKQAIGDYPLSIFSW